VLAVGKMPGEC